MLMHEMFEKHPAGSLPRLTQVMFRVKFHSGGHCTSLSASSPAARVPPPRNTARCGSSPCAERRRRSWPGTGQWRCYWGLWGKDGAGNAVLMPRDCKTEQNAGTTVCRDRTPIPCEAQTRIPKATPHEGERSPRFSSLCSRGEGTSPRPNLLGAKGKGTRKEMKNARQLRRWPTVTQSVKMLLTICYRTARLAARVAVTSQFSNRTRRESEREGRTGQRESEVQGQVTPTTHRNTALLGPHGSTAFTEKT